MLVELNAAREIEEVVHIAYAIVRSVRELLLVEGVAREQARVSGYTAISKAIGHARGCSSSRSRLTVP